MAKHWRKIIPLVLLQPLVPWWFSGYSSGGIMGVPVWAVYAVAACLAYALVVCWLLGRFWDEQAGSEDDAPPAGGEDS